MTRNNLYSRQRAILPTVIYVSPDEIYDTYVDIDSNLQMDVNIYNSLLYKPEFSANSDAKTAWNKYSHRAVPYFSTLNKLIFLICCVLPSLHKRDLKLDPNTGLCNI